MNRPKLNLIFLNQLSILEQLHLEEALLRVDQQNWCIIHSAPFDAIVMGISAKPEQVIDLHKLQQKPIPVIRRFSGGGTVVIDENCIMTTFICNQSEINIPCFPQPVFQWSETFYQPIFKGLEFRLHENDYVIGERKFGGNAQYMTKNRWLHHTSFLWDYYVDKMAYLKIPPKMPQYRQQRSHQEFLCKLNNHFSNQQEFLERLYKQLEECFSVHKVELSEIQNILQLPHRRTTTKIFHKDIDIN